MLVTAICKIPLDKDYSFSVDFVPVALEQLWIERCAAAHKSPIQSMFFVSYLALGQSPAVEYETQAVLAGFGL